MRTFISQWRRGGAAFLAAVFLACAAHAAEPAFVPSAELLAAAKKEGKIVLYTANFLDTEQAVVKRFSQRFPGIQIEIVRAPTGSLITRVKSEAAANRMIADVIDFTDRPQARAMVELFAPYAPPNAADYPAIARTTDRLWPRSGNAWTITYNSELVKDPPKSWADLAKPEFGKLHLGQTVVAAGGGPFARAMFERKVLGRGLLGQAGGAQAGAVSQPGPDGRCHDPRRDRHCAAGHRAGDPADRAGRAAQMVLRAGGRSGHGVLRRNGEGRGASQCREAVSRLVAVARGSGADGRARLVLQR